MQGGCLKLLGFLVLVSVVGALHTLQQMPNVQGYNMKAQLDKLEAQQAAFEAALDKISRDLELTSSKVDQANDTEKVMLLENSILRQRHDIYTISTKILPPFNLSKCSCENLTDKEKVLMLADLDVVRKNVLNVQDTLRDIPRCQKIDAIKKDVDKQLFFVQSMEDILYARCLRVILLSPTIFQTNLYVDNWVLGDQTADEVVDQYYQRSLRYNNVTNCPLSKPFFVGTQCVVCTEPTPTFNLLQRRCISCGLGGSVDTVARKCINKNAPFRTNYDAPNYSLDGLQGIPPSPKGAIETCPILIPFFDGVKCIPCPLNSYFSVLNGFCKTCPAGQVFDTVRKICVPSVSLTVLSTQTTVTTTTGPVVGKYSTNFLAGNFIVSTTKNQQQYRQQEQQRISNDPQIKTCPIETPYFNGASCVSCKRQPYIYFNLETRKCTTCPKGATYDPQLKRCFSTRQVTTVETVPVVATRTGVPGNVFLSNLRNNLWITVDGNVSKVLLYNRQVKDRNPDTPVCPIQTPFFNGQSCISCPTYFNVDTKECQGCREGTVFNPNLHVCEVATSATTSPFQTNPSKTPNLIYDGISSEQYRHIYEGNVANNPNIRDCDSSTPYWSGKQCIACSRQAPYFNMDAKVCQNCSAGSAYNPTSKECEDKQGKYINQGPTIEKVIAGIM